MKKTILGAAALTFAVFAGLSVWAANTKTIGTYELTGWQTLRMSETRVEAKGGRTYLHKSDGTVESKADSIVVTLSRQKGAKTTNAAANLASSVKSADLSGDVWLVFKKKNGDSVQTTEARADNAHIDWATQIATLNGNVSVTSTDPTVFAQPSHLKGDSATILLKKNLGPDEYRVTIQSTSERSHVDVTPKPKE